MQQQESRSWWSWRRSKITRQITPTSKSVEDTANNSNKDDVSLKEVISHVVEDSTNGMTSAFWFY